MYGITANCPKPKKPPCYTPCAHSEKIRDQLVEEAGSRGVIKLLVDTQLALQEEFLQTMCESQPSLKPIAQLSGMQCVTAIDDGCSDICGEQKRLYSAGSECLIVSCDFDDGFYSAVIRARRIKKNPTGQTLRQIADLFGWSIIYTPEFIALDIGSDPPEKALSIYKLFPVPIGESLQIIGDCQARH